MIYIVHCTIVNNIQTTASDLLHFVKSLLKCQRKRIKCVKMASYLAHTFQRSLRKAQHYNSTCRLLSPNRNSKKNNVSEQKLKIPKNRIFSTKKNNFQNLRGFSLVLRTPYKTFNIQALDEQLTNMIFTIIDQNFQKR